MHTILFAIDFLITYIFLFSFVFILLLPHIDKHCHINNSGNPRVNFTITPYGVISAQGEELEILPLILKMGSK